MSVVRPGDHVPPLEAVAKLMTLPTQKAVEAIDQNPMGMNLSRFWIASKS